MTATPAGTETVLMITGVGGIAGARIPTFVVVAVEGLDAHV